MVYHKKLSEEWEQFAQQLALSLSSEFEERTKINIIGTILNPVRRSLTSSRTKSKTEDPHWQ